MFYLLTLKIKTARVAQVVLISSGEKLVLMQGLDPGLDVDPWNDVAPGDLMTNEVVGHQVAMKWDASIIFGLLRLLFPVFSNK